VEEWNFENLLHSAAVVASLRAGLAWPTFHPPVGFPLFRTGKKTKKKKAKGGGRRLLRLPTACCCCRLTFKAAEKSFFDIESKVNYNRKERQGESIGISPATPTSPRTAQRRRRRRLQSVLVFGIRFGIRNSEKARSDFRTR